MGKRWLFWGRFDIFVHVEIINLFSCRNIFLFKFKHASISLCGGYRTVMMHD